MLELGILVFGIVTNSILPAMGWIFLRIGNFIPEKYLTISAVAVIVLCISRKFLKLGGVS